MKNKYITDALINQSNSCNRAAWMTHNCDPIEIKVSASMQFLLNESSKVRKAAIASMGGEAYYVKFRGYENSCLDTNQAISQRKEIIVGGILEFNQVFVSIDCLKKTAKGYTLIILSSKSKTTEDCIKKASLQAAALVSSGYKLDGLHVWHLDTGKNQSIFRIGAVFDHEIEQPPVILDEIAEVVSMLKGGAPAGVSSDHCEENGGCVFASGCDRLIKVNSETDVSLLPSHAGAVKKAIASGINKITDLPKTALSHKRNALMHASLSLGKRVVTAKSRQDILALPYPWHFIDFESCAFALPRFDDSRPYQPIVFQWSIHSQSCAGAPLEHKEFLDLSGQDPRRKFIESLLDALGEDGTVVVFSSFEKTRLNELAELFPDLSARIANVIKRIFDAYPAARHGYYSGKMMGKWGLKSIAPTLPACPDLVAYTELCDVANGMAAQAAYGAAVDGVMTPNELQFTRKNMLDYCKMDTRTLAHLVYCMAYSDEVVCLNI